MASSVDEFLQNTEKQSYIDLCKICLRNKSQYTCPRCNTQYCSLNCYKSEVHVDCSESFYQEWVENELKSNRVTPEGQRKMVEILNRLNFQEGTSQDQLDSDDDDPSPDIADRLSGIDLDDADKVWEKLSANEQAAFKELVTSGGVANIIPPWEPWWTEQYDEPLITPMSMESTSECQAYKKLCPPVYNKLKPLPEICKTPPSPTVIYDLLNILGGYALTVRYFNGEYYDMPEEATTIIFNISKSLECAQKFTSKEMALEAVGLQALIYQGIETGEKEIDIMKDDVQFILNGPCRNDRTYYILAALSDLHNLFSFKKHKKKTTSKGKFFQNFPCSSDPDIKLIDRKSITASLRRISFMQSWTISITKSTELNV